MPGAAEQMSQQKRNVFATTEVQMFSIVKPVLPLFLGAAAIAILLGLGHQVQVLYILILVFISAVRWEKLNEWDLVRRWRGDP